MNKPKNFEELLEVEMAKGTGGGGINVAEISPSQHKQVGSSAPKRDFLKRKSEKATLPPASSKRSLSKYKYYVDNFKEVNGGDKSKRESAVVAKSALPEKQKLGLNKQASVGGFRRDEDKTSNNQDNLSSANQEENNDPGRRTPPPEEG
jgi:hypothetical protein